MKLFQPLHITSCHNKCLYLFSFRFTQGHTYNSQLGCLKVMDNTAVPSFGSNPHTMAIIPNLPF